MNKNLQERGSFIVEPSCGGRRGPGRGRKPARRGHGRGRVCREKKQTNTRSATADVYESLTPSRKLTLEESLETRGQRRVRRGDARRPCACARSSWTPRSASRSPLASAAPTAEPTGDAPPPARGTGGGGLASLARHHRAGIHANRPPPRRHGDVRGWPPQAPLPGRRAARLLRR